MKTVFKIKKTRKMKRTKLKEILSLIALLAMINPRPTYANEVISYETNMNEEDDIESIIQTYHLEDNQQLIMDNLNDFLKYYETMQNNPSIPESDYEIVLNNFEIIKKYSSDFNIQLEKLAKRKIVIDDEACKEKEALGFYVPGTDTITLRSDADKDTKTHENIHHIFDTHELYFNEGEVVNTNANTYSFNKIYNEVYFNEAIASDLAGIEYGKYGFARSYPELTAILQTYYLIYGRDEFLKSYSKPDFLEKLYHDFQNSGLTYEEIDGIFHHLELLDQLSKSGNEKLDYNQVVYDCTLDLIKVYESLTKENWQDSLKFKTILVSLLKNVNLNQTFIKIDKENNQISYEASKELKNLKTNPDFLDKYNIDLANTKKIQTVVESEHPELEGEMAISLLGPKNNKYPSHQEYIVINSGHVKNHIVIDPKIMSQQEKIRIQKSYGIDDRTILIYEKYYSFFTLYEKCLDSTNFTEEEKKNVISNFPNFLMMYPEFFTNEKNTTNIELLFQKMIWNCFTKEDFKHAYYQKDELYNRGCPDFFEKLEYLNIVDENMKRFYALNYYQFIAYKNYVSKKFPDIDEANLMELIVQFPELIKNYPEFQDLSKDDTLNYLYKVFGSCLNLEDFTFLINTSYGPSGEIDYKRKCLVLN